METNPPTMPAPQSPPPPLRQRSGGRWLWVTLFCILSPIIGGVVLIALVMVAAGLFVKGERSSVAGVDEVPTLKSVWSYGAGDTKVVRIPVKGVLVEQEESGLFSAEGPVGKALKQIRAATVDHDVKAIILEVDSPGGGVTASDLIHKALIDFKQEEPGRKVIALLGDIAASGGYYVAVAADCIIAHPTTLTGSIGVLISKLNIKQLGDQYGVKLETIKSGKNKDLLSPFETLTDEQREVLQKVVDEMHSRFVSLVADGRKGLTEEQIRQLADGRVFSASAALENKLIDEIGYWDDAVARAREMLDVEDVKVIRYSEESFLSMLLKGVQPVKPLSQLRLADMMQARLMYIWQVW